MRLIDADAFRREIDNHWPFTKDEQSKHGIADMAKSTLIVVLNYMPTVDAVEVVRCKDCIHQEKFFHEDKRRKGGGYYVYGCELADGYSHVCLDGDFCSRGKRRSDE